MKKKIYVAVFLWWSVCTILPAQGHRGLYIWGTASFISNNAERNRIINSCIAFNIEHIYLYAFPTVITGHKAGIQAFISKAGCYDIKVWAMDGDREYFSDHPARGNAEFYDFVDAVIAYNATVAPNERFIGISADLEPHDQGPVIGPPYSFHNDVTDSDLSTVPGSGVWQSTQKLDREMLMRNWLEMSENTYNICHANNLLFGMSMVNWVDDYYGEPVQCTYNSVTMGVMEHMMNYVDDYLIMSYNTTTNGIRNRMLGELTYANTLPAASRPKIWGGVETHDIGNGVVSYYNHASKNTKAAVINDIGIVEGMISGNVSYYGMNIHDWIFGWRDLAPFSSNTADPGVCTLPVNLISFRVNNVNNAHVLRWITDGEVNNDHFVIEYSYDGINFEQLDLVQGRGNASTKVVYEYTNHGEDAPLVYYRLRQVDLDGTYSHSEIVSARTEGMVSLYPSPAQNTIAISMKNGASDKIQQLSIIDGRGVEVLSLKVDLLSSMSLDISALATGIYCVKIQCLGDNLPRILKFEKVL